MIMDHITYFKNIIEQSILVDDKPILQGKLYELYPEPSTFIASLPCAVIGHRIGTAKQTGGIDTSKVTDTDITLTREMIQTTHPYQIDFYSKTINDFIDDNNILTQFIREVTKKPYYLCNDGRIIMIHIGAFGLLDEPELIEQGPYKAFCQVTIEDAVYGTTIVPRITTIQFDEGGVYE